MIEKAAFIHISLIVCDSFVSDALNFVNRFPVFIVEFINVPA